MKRILPYCFLMSMVSIAGVPAMAQNVEEVVAELSAMAEDAEIENEVESLAADSIIMVDPQAVFDSMPTPVINPRVLNLSLSPKVFSGYQKIQEIPQLSQKVLKPNLEVMTPLPEPIDDMMLPENEWPLVITLDSVPSHLQETITEIVTSPVSFGFNEENVAAGEELPSIIKYKTPQWLRNSIGQAAAQENLLYSYMIDNPQAIEYAYWDLPLPPVLLEEDRSFIAFLKKQEVPEVSVDEAIIPEIMVKKKHWLHKFGAQLQFSQAYVSPNWYQGGNSYLSLLFGFNWNVNLNQVYHPNLLFQSDLTYKLAINSNPKGSGSIHRYTIAEDNFQYNLNTGLKAVKDWFYSLNLQFKTQLLNNYAADSHTRTASFLSPGDLNIGLGMAYTHKNKLNTFQYTLTVSPLSYNLKTCISSKVDHATYGIAVDKRSKSEIGSNLDFTMQWSITTNISYKTRVFMFTDYKYYLCDWQNTFNFEINKFLSTQLFLHLRYDGSLESSTSWKKFMMREILSFGLSYTFSTKP